MKLLALLLLTAVTISCTNNKSQQSIMNAIHEYSDNLKARTGAKCGMYGLDYSGSDNIYDGKIHTISLGYDTDRRMQFNEARTFFYEIVDGLLTHLNNNEKIRANFFHYPLTYADLEFHLNFDFDHRDSLKKNEVESIHIRDNEIVYFIVDKEGLEENSTSDMSSLQGFFGNLLEKYRAIRKKLPEKLSTIPHD